MSKFLSSVKHGGRLYQAGETVPSMSEVELQALVDAGAVEGEPTHVDAVGTPNNPTRLGVGEVNPQMSVETFDAQIEQKEAELKELREKREKFVAPETEKEEEDAGAPVDPTKKMTQKQLLAHAREQGVDVKDEMTKDEIRDAIKAHNESQANA